MSLPYTLSILAHGDPNAEVTGLKEFDRSLWPPLFVHYLFDAMVLIGMYLLLVPLLYFILRRLGKRTPPWLLRMIVCGGPLAMLAIEVGWIFAEVGRQPWILRGYMKTSGGVTTADHVGEMLLLFALLYLLLAVVSALVLRKMFKHNPPEKELRERKWNVS